MRTAPYAAARRTSARRSRSGAVATWPRTKVAPARHAEAMISISISSPPEGHDLLEQHGTDGHHSEPEEHEHVAEVCVEERRHVARVRQRDHPRDEKRYPDERVRGHPPHRRERPDLPRELLTVSHRLRHHVEERCERAADLALDGDRRDGEREVLGADAVGHVSERVVKGSSESC